MVEQLTLNQLVEGSSPSWSTILNTSSRGNWPLSLKKARSPLALHFSTSALPVIGSLHVAFTGSGLVVRHPISMKLGLENSSRFGNH